MSWHGPLAGGANWRKAVAIVAIFGGATGCSGGGSPSVESAQEVTTAPPTKAPQTTAPPIVPAIEVRLVVDGKPTSANVVVDDFGGSDPFGQFAACSGLRSSFGAYQMLVSGSEDLGGSIQVNATTNPHDSGSVPASARIETTTLTTEIVGVLDLADDYRSGRFLGNTADGNRVVVEFDCQSGNEPKPLDRTRPYVDVAMLVVRGDERRVLSLGLMQPCGDNGVDAGMPAGEPGSSGLSKVVIGPDTLELYVGGERLTLAETSVAATSATAGTFEGATPDGATITGAYSCRA